MILFVLSFCVSRVAPIDLLRASWLLPGGLPYGYLGKKELALCVRTVRLLDCESAYYFPKSWDVCTGLDPPVADSATAASNAESNVETAGHLVIHVRSGDVFRIKKAYGSYGQVSYESIYGLHTKVTTCVTATSYMHEYVSSNNYIRTSATGVHFECKREELLQ